MKKKLLLIITIQLFTSVISYSQYDISIKAYATYGFISPDQINNHFKYLNNITAKTEFPLDLLNDKKISSINSTLGYGFGLQYDFMDYFGVGFSFEDFSSTNKNYYYYNKTGGGFFGYQYRIHRYKMNYSFSSLSIKPIFKYFFNNNIFAFLSLGPNINFGKIDEEYLGFYEFRHPELITGDKYFTKDKSVDIGWFCDLGIDYNFYSRFSLEVSGSYKSVVHEFKGNFSMAKDAKVEFDITGFYLSAGLKIRIL